MVCLSKVSPKATVKKQMTSPRPIALMKTIFIWITLKPVLGFNNHFNCR